MLTRKQLLAGAVTGAGGYLASGALGGGKGHGWGTTHKLGRTTTTTSTGPHDTTSIIDDLGAVEFAAHTNYSNQDKYGTMFFGAEESYYIPLPGRCLKYCTGNQSQEGNEISVPVSTCRTGAGGHGWLVHDNAGAEILYQGNFLTNPGNVDYQAAWKSRALTYFTNNPGADGVFIDNFEVSASNFSGTAYPIKDQENNVIWNNNSDFQAAQISFSANCHAYVKNTLGKLVVPNAKGFISGSSTTNDGTDTKTWMDQYYAYVTGMVVEFWNLDATGAYPVTSAMAVWDGSFGHSWNGWTSVHEHANSLGINFYPSDALSSTMNSQIRFLRGSFLLNWQGGRDCWVASTDLGDPWNTDIARDPGQPLSAKVYLGIEGCWKRQYEHYLIYVNANPASQTLDGHTIASGDALWIAT